MRGQSVQRTVGLIDQRLPPSDALVSSDLALCAMPFAIATTNPHSGDWVRPAVFRSWTSWRQRIRHEPARRAGRVGEIRRARRVADRSQTVGGEFLAEIEE